LFTDTAVRSLTVYIAYVSPVLANWVTENIELVVFIYAFTWIFLLSSVIPSLLLGKKRSILVQYMVCLILAVLALSVQGLLLTYGGIEISQIFAAATFLSNPFLAGLYLAVPYLIMLALDLRTKKQIPPVVAPKEPLPPSPPPVASSDSEP
jgi:hypothetical protein